MESFLLFRKNEEKKPGTTFDIILGFSICVFTCISQIPQMYNYLRYRKSEGISFLTAFIQTLGGYCGAVNIFILNYGYIQTCSKDGFWICTPKLTVVVQSVALNILCFINLSLFLLFFFNNRTKKKEGNQENSNNDVETQSFSDFSKISDKQKKEKKESKLKKFFFWKKKTASTKHLLSVNVVNGDYDDDISNDISDDTSFNHTNIKESENENKNLLSNIESIPDYSENKSENSPDSGDDNNNDFTENDSSDIKQFSNDTNIKQFSNDPVIFPTDPKLLSTSKSYSTLSTLSEDKESKKEEKNVTSKIHYWIYTLRKNATLPLWLEFRIDLISYILFAIFIITTIGCSAMFLIQTEIFGYDSEPAQFFAQAMGIISLVLVIPQWLPQIFLSILLGNGGNFSLVSLSITLPGAFIIVFWQAILTTQHWTSWGPFCLSGTQQLVLWLILIFYKGKFFFTYCLKGFKKK